VNILQACHARIAAPKTQLGLPELTLGIIPGFGGKTPVLRLSISAAICTSLMFHDELKVFHLILSSIEQYFFEIRMAWMHFLDCF